MSRILVLNGPNLNMLGIRNPAIYGSTKLVDINRDVVAKGAALGFEVEAFQSNHEGDLIDQLQKVKGHFAGIILNAGGLTHTSVSLRDAVECAHDQGIPTVEVHLTDISVREEFRQKSLLTDVCVGCIKGQGPVGYNMALDLLLPFLNKK